MISLEVLPRLTGQCRQREALKNQAVPVSDIGLDSAVANETSGDLRLVVTAAYRAFVLLVSYACDGCCLASSRGRRITQLSEAIAALKKLLAARVTGAAVHKGGRSPRRRRMKMAATQRAPWAKVRIDGIMTGAGIELSSPVQGTIRILERPWDRPASPAVPGCSTRPALRH
jgi:hypothetical protein